MTLYETIDIALCFMRSAIVSYLNYFRCFDSVHLYLVLVVNCYELFFWLAFLESKMLNLCMMFLFAHNSFYFGKKIFSDIYFH